MFIMYCIVVKWPYRKHINRSIIISSHCGDMKKKKEKMEDMSRLVLIKWFVAALLCGACIIEIQKQSFTKGLNVLHRQNCTERKYNKLLTSFLRASNG